MPLTYAIPMMMLRKTLIAGLGALAMFTFVSPAAEAGNRRDEQDAARRARLDGQVIPFSMIKRRVDSRMGDATYVGSEFNAGSNRYRLKYVKNGQVVWVDADGRTGDITGWAR